MADEEVAQLLVELTNLRRTCERFASGGNPAVRQMAAADVRSIDRAIQSIRSCDGDSAAVLRILNALRPSGSPIRANVVALAANWKMKRIPASEATDLAEDDLFERVVRDGEPLVYKYWDSGGPGAGAGRVCVYLYEGLYYSTHDAGLSGPFETEAEARRSVGL